MKIYFPKMASALPFNFGAFSEGAASHNGRHISTLKNPKQAIPGKHFRLDLKIASINKYSYDRLCKCNDLDLKINDFLLWLNHDSRHHLIPGCNLGIRSAEWTNLSSLQVLGQGDTNRRHWGRIKMDRPPSPPDLQSSVWLFYLLMIELISPRI